VTRFPPLGRSFSGEVRVPPRPSRSPGAFDPSERIQIFEDAGGAIALGPVAADVIYVCLVDHLGPGLTAVSARRLEQLLARQASCSLFLDAHDPSTFDLAARTELVRCLYPHRKKLRLVVSLVRTQAVRASVVFISLVLGAVECTTDDGAEFDDMLIALAPHAHERIAPRNWVRAAASEQPRVKIAQSG
jgi:hypothetical protein